MSYTQNEKLIGLVPYEPNPGDYPIRLDANESFRTPPLSMMKEISEEILHVEYNRYPDPTARAVCEAFADYYAISPEWVMAGNGSDELIFVILSAFLMKGDKILILSPDFSMYNFYSSLVESPSLVLHKGDLFSLSVDDIIRRAKEEQVKLIIFSNPCNPTSLGWPREDIDRLVRAVDALVVLDEAYMDFWDQSMLPHITDYDNLIVLRTMSKALGMAAIRLGFAVSNPAIRTTLLAVKSPYNVNAVTQAVGTVVLRHPEELRQARAAVILSRDRLYDGCAALAARYPALIRIDKPCTNFVTIHTPYGTEINEHLLEKGILVRRFTHFLRITCGTAAENEAFLQALDTALHGLNQNKDLKRTEEN